MQQGMQSIQVYPGRTCHCFPSPDFMGSLQDLPFANPVDEPMLPETAAIRFEGGEERLISKMMFGNRDGISWELFAYILIHFNHIGYPNAETCFELLP